MTAKVIAAQESRDLWVSGRGPLLFGGERRMITPVVVAGLLPALSAPLPRTTSFEQNVRQRRSRQRFTRPKKR
jgi:hypothetical protein